ncbi:MAG: AbrB/MazE/SpoVT family DNA-binding domain-containing protein [Candidatus Helarchaeota archaeon]
MEKSKVKKIGHSWYIKIPPKIHKQITLHDGDEILIGQVGNRLEIRFATDKDSNDLVLVDLEEGLSLGAPKKLVREELYETDRY